MLREPQVRDALVRHGLFPAGGRPERMERLLKLELAPWSRVVADAGISDD